MQNSTGLTTLMLTSTLSSARRSVSLALCLDPDNLSACTLENMFKAILAVCVRLLQIILLLVQIRQFLGQHLTLILQSLLNIWNWCADKPGHFVNAPTSRKYSLITGLGCVALTYIFPTPS